MGTTVKKVAKKEVSKVSENITSQSTETLVKVVEKKQIKFYDEFIIKGGNFNNDKDIFICCGLNENGTVNGYKKFNDLGELESETNESQRFIFELAEIKSFKSLVLMSESQNKTLEKIQGFDKTEANEIQKLRHITNVCKVEQMGLNKCLKAFLTNAKGVLSPKQLTLLTFDKVLDKIKVSRYRYNTLYTPYQIALICNDILKANDYKAKASAKVSRQGGLIGKKADKITKVSNKKAA